ncbi:MAG: hypothetical protein V3U16_00420 [Candidatus Neomarinimicrobiota bacterium]
MKQFLLLWLVAVIPVIMPGQSNNFSLHGQLSSWEKSVDPLGSSTHYFGIQYIPEYYGSISRNIDGELSLNIAAIKSFGNNTDTDIEEIKVKAYRAWLRFSTNRLDARIGLQEINFGPGKFLRPLRWFDQLDPRDPLQIITGIYGLRLKYDFMNNTNLWFWGLYGNNDVKGWESLPTYEDRPEFGGRVQIPLFNGELALTSHFRWLDDALLFEGQEDDNKEMGTNKQPTPEIRFAIDGIWDVGPGVWFESVNVQSDLSTDQTQWTNLITVGLDYTFMVGNSLLTTFEHLAVSQDDVIWEYSDPIQTTAAMITYPFSLLDQFSLIGLYQWKWDLTYIYLSWQRTYDHWIIHLSGFTTQNANDLERINLGGSQLDPLGFQLTIIFNH